MSERRAPRWLRATELVWTRRVGTEAARHRVRYYQVYARAWALSALGMGLAIGGGLAGLPPVAIAGGAVIGGWAIGMALAGRELMRMNDAIRKKLGVSFGFWSGPPNQEELYVAWCEKHGVQPNPFSG